MEETGIISALIGLVGACSNNPKTENTDQVLIKALAFPLTQPNANAQALQEIIEQIHTEKFTIAPGCAVCQTPCGNTSDYDMRRIYDAGEDIRNIKLEILSQLQELAAELYRCKKTDSLSPEFMEFFYKALAYVSFDMEKENLLAFNKETQETIQRIRRYTEA